MTLEQAIERVASNLNPIDFGTSFFAGAVQKPWNALSQLSGDRLPAIHLVSEDYSTLAGQAGNIAGVAADMLLLSRLTGKAANSLFRERSCTPLISAAKLGFDGAIYGGIFSASDPSKSLLRGRFENAAISGISFTVLGAAGHALSDAALFGATSLKSNALNGALAGAAGGLSYSFARAGIQDHTLPSPAEVAADTASYAALGAVFTAGSGLLNDWQITRRAKAEFALQDKVSNEMAGKATERVGDWYGLLEPRLAMYLTDPNVVLTLADARGQTEFFVRNAQPLDPKAFERLNSVTEPHGVRFRPTGFMSDVTGTPGLSVDVESLAGLQKSTAASNLKGIRKFNANEGFAGMDRWKGETANALLELQNSGYYPASAEVTHLRIGVAKGYPDEAILALNIPAVAPDPPFLLSTEIPYSDHYLCAEPNYQYSAKDYNRIQLHSNVWGEVLRKYYESDWHRTLAADRLFNELRQEALTAEIDGSKRAGFSVDDQRYVNAQRSLGPRPSVEG
jgi:hypothetical protein